MVKQAFKRLILRCFPELGERKHLPQLALIEKIYDLPTESGKISTPFRPYKAVDIQLLDPVTHEPTNTPVFEQVTLATGQANDAGLVNEPKPGMYCMVQYIDGLNSHPVITNLLPWGALVPEQKHTDVGLKQSSRAQIQGRDGNWIIETDDSITQVSDSSAVQARKRVEQFHVKQSTIATHETNHIDGNQINEVMGALKTVVGEKALFTALEGLLLGSQKQINIKARENVNIESLMTLHIKANELSKLEGAKVWVGDKSVNAIEVLHHLIIIVKDLCAKLENHGHSEQGAGPPLNKAELSELSKSAGELETNLSVVV
ncbi:MULTISPECIES: hypothetical protein [Pseudoalteromonas]|uniref:Gp5/Type VI secretion system Vgr protein OB-fold domain-containing protein n=1 Tax=Pseudoalteromonas obscura TaxID=3048491 RepID=A0ABT7EJG4_9GAMM|nr:MULTISPECIES: hypothetical protein [Pseudoalteromonas]MBQ4836768.1 hypothetical protein [Pseudoalteromonas luteoviolacea]MDK2595196.1 hypothetical protein [Pseudoalteromonas sp. P94(2023)]